MTLPIGLGGFAATRELTTGYHESFAMPVFSRNNAPLSAASGSLSLGFHWLKPMIKPIKQPIGEKIRHIKKE
jgi:hypothetical protein